ncbi:MULTISPECIES: MFS transporter [unclassified Nostoc]|uniref:MFS transporter n=1 Tax=unclassified Nostoc TaxID=2593658 RepID=UPI002AD1F40E|nr:MFS transporter [Nostoc sp. DedQUE03]MDZ7976373.1 MFS transporter [Nostoc sp. DedQUE03]MDZ8047987.1 MFS transporter [Nostoc sp. DedQUE02]
MMSNVQMIEKTRLNTLREIQLLIIVWIGQLIALIGSSTTAFALDIWVYNRTGSVTRFALVSLFNTLPLILISPIAGPLVDMWDRRKTVIFADVLACLGTILSLFGIAILTGGLLVSIWGGLERNIYICHIRVYAFEWRIYFRRRFASLPCHLHCWYLLIFPNTTDHFQFHPSCHAK